MRSPLAWWIDRRLSAYQEDLLRQHYEEVESIYRQMRGWKHDYHNHIQTMMVLAAGNDRLTAYLDQLLEDLSQVDSVLKTGNIMVDAIVGSKLSIARQKEIRVEAAAFVPPQLSVSDIDLCVILGNLLDNAIEANAQVTEAERRFLRLYLDVLKGQFYISISNATQGHRRKKDGGYHTTKTGFHGFGLSRVDHLVEKYQGYINRQSEEGVFATEILLPL